MENTQSNSKRYPLAIDSEGNAFDVSAAAVAWRVRKLAAKAGRPKLIFDTETGRPLEVALAATANDLAECLTESGRYRLEAVDAQGRTLPGCVATTELAVEEEDSEAPATLRSLSLMEHMFAQMISSNAKLVDSNTRVMEALAQRFALVSISEPEREQVVAAPPVAPAATTKTGSTADNLEAFSKIAAQVMSMVQAMRAAQPGATNGQPSDPVAS